MSSATRTSRRRRGGSRSPRAGPAVTIGAHPPAGQPAAMSRFSFSSPVAMPVRVPDCRSSAFTPIAAWESCSSSAGYTGLADGGWSFEVGRETPRRRRGAHLRRMARPRRHHRPCVPVAERTARTRHRRTKRTIRFVPAGDRASGRSVSARRRIVQRGLLERDVLGVGADAKASTRCASRRRTRSATSGSRTWSWTIDFGPPGSGIARRPIGTRPFRRRAVPVVVEGRPVAVPVLVRRVDRDAVRRQVHVGPLPDGAYRLAGVGARRGDEPLGAVDVSMGRGHDPAGPVADRDPRGRRGHHGDDGLVRHLAERAGGACSAPSTARSSLPARPRSSPSGCSTARTRSRCTCRTGRATSRSRPHGPGPSTPFPEVRNVPRTVSDPVPIVAPWETSSRSTSTGRPRPPRSGHGRRTVGPRGEPAGSAGQALARPHPGRCRARAGTDLASGLRGPSRRGGRTSRAPRRPAGTSRGPRIAVPAVPSREPPSPPTLGRAEREPRE